MARGINLLQKEQEDIQLLDLAHKLKVGSIVFLIFYCLVVLAVFSFSIYLQQATKATTQSIETKKQKINSLKKVESLQLIFKQRLSSLSGIMNDKKVSSLRLLEAAQQPSEPGVTIGKMSIPESELLIIGGTALNAPALGRFLDKLTSEKSIFTTIVVSSAARQKNGSYLFNINLTSE